MGIVAKQSILNTIITYVGFGFGAVNTLFLFTNILSEEDYGVVSYLLASSNLLWPLMAFGMQNTLIKFYHSYATEQMKSRIFSWILLMPLLMLLLIGSGYLIFYDQIMEHYSQSNAVMKSYVWVIIVTGFASAYFELFYAWAKVHLKSVKGNLLKEIFHRVCISALLIAVYYGLVSSAQFIFSLASIYLLRTIFMLIVAFNIKKPIFNLGSLPNLNSILTYSFLILIAATVSVFLLDLDKIMIEDFMPISNVAIYSICIYMASVIEVPTRAILQITNPLTAQLLAKNDIKALSNLNKKTSLTTVIVTVLIGALVICNVHSMFAMVPKQYVLYIEIVLLISFVKLFDASLGITNSILFNSDSYKWILVFGVGVLVLAYFLNTFLIPDKGLVGAAFATFLAYSIYNVAKLVFVYAKFKIQPFVVKSIIACLLGFAISYLFYNWQLLNIHPILQIGIKGMLISILYISCIYFLKLSPEINTAIFNFIKKR